jgi:predicted esterase
MRTLCFAGCCAAALLLAASSAAAASDYGLTTTVPADCSDTTAVVVFGHGLGDTGKGWEPTLRVVHATYPHVCFVVPTARKMVTKLDPQNAVPAWYDVSGKEMSDDKLEGDVAGILASAMHYRTEVLAQLRRIGEGWDRVIVAGFSQGAVVALHAGLSLPAQCAGVVAIGGYLGAPAKLLATATRRSRNEPAAAAGGAKALSLDKKQFFAATPVLMIHGADDNVVPLSAAQKAVAKLRRVGVAAVELAEFAGLKHGMNDAAMTRFVDFIGEKLPVHYDSAEL